LLDVFRSAKIIFNWLRRPLTLKPKPQYKKSMSNATVALLVKLEAKPGKEKEVEAFLRGALPLVQEEPETVAWFAIRMDKSTFGIVDAFPSDAGRQAHLSGKVAAALMAKASELFATAPAIEKVDVLAAKLP
jgi:quinol monooxygenase YgiN